MGTGRQTHVQPWQILMAVAAAALLGATGAAGAGEPAYEIDTIVPLTGGASFVGKSMQDTMLLSEKALNQEGGIDGRPVHFVFHDDQSKPQVAVQLANAAVAKRPAVVFGSSITAMCNAMAPLMANGPVQYCLSPGVHPAAGSYMLTANVSSADYLTALVRFFRLKGWTRIATITTTDSSGQDADRGLDEVLRAADNKDVVVAERAHFDPSDVSVAAQIERIRAAKPQALIAWATGASVATIYRGMMQAGLDIPVAPSTSTMVLSQIAQYEAFLPRQVYFATTEWVANGDPRLDIQPEVAAEQKRFFAALKEAGRQPDGVTEIGWDPPRLIVAALRKLGPGATAAQLRGYIAQVDRFAGIDGVYNFAKTPQRGLNIDSTLVARWMPAEKRWVAVSRRGGTPLDD